MRSKPMFGLLDVHAVYSPEGRVEVSLLRAENLIPLDLNGSSDPFVVIRVVPEIAFPEQPERRTEV